MSTGCFFLLRPLTIQPDTGYPARPDIRPDTGYPAKQIGSVSDATLVIAGCPPAATPPPPEPLNQAGIIG